MTAPLAMAAHSHGRRASAGTPKKWPPSSRPVARRGARSSRRRSRRGRAGKRRRGSGRSRDRRSIAPSVARRASDCRARPTRYTRKHCRVAPRVRGAYDGRSHLNSMLRSRRLRFVLIASAVLVSAFASACALPSPPSGLRRTSRAPADRTARSQRARAPSCAGAATPKGARPYVEADPVNPAILRGFDVEVAALLAKGLGRTPQFVQVAWSSIDASVRRGDFDIGMSGVEDTPARRAQLARHDPLLRVPRGAHRPSRRRGTVQVARRPPRPAGRHARRHAGVRDAAGRRHARTPSLPCPTTTTCIRTPTWRTAGWTRCCWTTSSRRAPSGTRRACSPSRRPSPSGTTSACWRPDRRPFATGSTRSSSPAMRDGRLERIYRTVANLRRRPGRVPSTRRHRAAGGVRAVRRAGRRRRPGRWPPPCAISPRCFARLVISVVLSCLSMALAVVVGIAVASGRLYGNRLLRLALTCVRGGDARHAGPAAAVRDLLRAVVGGAAARIRRRLVGPRPQLRGVRERDLPGRAAGRAGRAARGRPDARADRGAGAAAHPRPAGVPTGARADDQRLRGAAQGLARWSR